MIERYSVNRTMVPITSLNRLGDSIWRCGPPRARRSKLVSVKLVCDGEVNGRLARVVETVTSAAERAESGAHEFRMSNCPMCFSARMNGRLSNVTTCDNVMAIMFVEMVMVMVMVVIWR